MAEVRIPFCATAEIPPPFILDEDYGEPNGVKSVLFDKSLLQVVGREESVDVPKIGPVKMCVYYVVGTIPYICNVFPIIQSEHSYDVQEQAAVFDKGTGNAAAVGVGTSTLTPLGWLSAVGSVNVEEPVGGNISLAGMPEIESVTVEYLAVANNSATTLNPTGTDATASGEESKRVIKWRGSFVVKTS